MIAISRITSGDSLVINELPTSVLYDVSPRVARYKTLDGGVIIDHQGYVVGDNTLTIRADLTEAEEETLRTLIENETLMHISTIYGFYTMAVENYVNDNGSVEISVLLKEAA